MEGRFMESIFKRRELSPLSTISCVMCVMFQIIISMNSLTWFGGMVNSAKEKRQNATFQDVNDWVY
jgi:hypothetical protein